jgi:hypothetical protein
VQISAAVDVPVSVDIQGTVPSAGERAEPVGALPSGAGTRGDQRPHRSFPARGR